MVDSKLMRWYTDDQRPVEVEVLEIFADIECTVRDVEIDEVFTAKQEYLHYKREDAWRAYGDFMQRIADYVGSYDNDVQACEIEEEALQECKVAFRALHGEEGINE